MFPLFLLLPDSKVLDPNRPIYRHESDKNKKYLSANNFVFLSVFVVVICSASTSYTSLCRGLKNLLKIPYFSQDYSNVVGFLIIETLCLGRSKTLPYVCKKYHKIERRLSLVAYIFTKLSQNVFLINFNIHIFMYA